MLNLNIAKQVWQRTEQFCTYSLLMHNTMRKAPKVNGKVFDVEWMLSHRCCRKSLPFWQALPWDINANRSQIISWGWTKKTLNVNQICICNSTCSATKPSLRKVEYCHRMQESLSFGGLRIVCCVTSFACEAKANLICQSQWWDKHAQQHKGKCQTLMSVTCICFPTGEAAFKNRILTSDRKTFCKYAETDAHAAPLSMGLALAQEQTSLWWVFNTNTCKRSGLVLAKLLRIDLQAPACALQRLLAPQRKQGQSANILVVDCQELLSRKGGKNQTSAEPQCKTRNTAPYNINQQPNWMTCMSRTCLLCLRRIIMPNWLSGCDVSSFGQHCDVKLILLC